MAFYLSPFNSFLQLFSESGVPLGGGLCWTYLAGTTTPAATYTDSTGLFANSNPIQMGSDGRLQNVTIWQQGGVALKYVFTTNAGTTASPVFGTQLGPTFDQVYGINDPAIFIVPQSGVFTPTWNGFSVAPTASQITYYVQGGFVSITFPVNCIGTSNATTFSMTGLPAAISPPNSSEVLIPMNIIIDNGANLSGAFAYINGIGNSITFYKADQSNFTASGNKGINQGSQLNYFLV